MHCCDMEFVLDSGQRVRGHKAWLTGRCEYVRMMFFSGLVEERTGVIHVRECSEEAFLAILEFLYFVSPTRALAAKKRHKVELVRVVDLVGMGSMILKRNRKIRSKLKQFDVMIHVMKEAGLWLFENAVEGGADRPIYTDMDFVLDSGRRMLGHKA